MAMKFFRKHQKVILACITIGTMFLFIVGDALTMSARGSDGRRRTSWLSKLFSGSDEGAVAIVQGTGYDPEQLREVAETRAYAYQFLTQIMSEAQLNYMLSLGLTEEDLRDQQKAQQKQEEILSKDPSKREPLTRRMSSLLVQAIRTTGPVGYDRQGNPTLRDAAPTVEFLLFKNKADSLGVTITPASVKDDLISVVGMNQLTEAQMTSVARAFGKRPTGQGRSLAKLDDILAVLADEVRAAIAMSVVQGDMLPSSQMSFMNSPADVTPGDLWATFVKVKTSLNVGIAPIKVEDYVKDVKNPTTEEAQAYFEKYKKEYPDPEKDTPGFRIPPMYRIGFLYADMTETKPARKHYNELVDAYDRLAPFTALGELVAEYEAKKFTTYRHTEPFLEFAARKQAGAPWVRVYKPYSKLDHAAAAALVANVGAALGQVNSLAPVDVFTMAQRGQAVPPAQNEVLNVASAFGAALGAANLPGTVLAPPKVREGQNDVFIPFNVVVGALVDQRYEKKSKQYLDQDLNEVSQQLSDYAKRYSEWRGKVLRKTAPANQPPFFKEDQKQTLQDYLTKFAAARGLEYHETKDLRSRNDLLKEPGDRLLNTFIKPIYADETIKTQRDLEDRVKYWLVRNELMGGQKPKLFETMNSGILKPQSKQVALHWVAEATDPRTPDFNEARPAVVQAWKLEKARPLAEQAAQDIIKKVKELPDNRRLLNDVKGYTPGQTVGQYTEPVLQATSPGISYDRCPVPTMIDYPPSDLVQQCLDKLKQDGDMTLLPNKPKDVYYLFYLSHRTEPKLSNPLDLDRFHTEVLRASITRPFTVEGRNFKSFAAEEKTAAEQKAWEVYVKSLTSFNDEKAKEYIERLKQRY